MSASSQQRSLFPAPCSLLPVLCFLAACASQTPATPDAGSRDAAVDGPAADGAPDVPAAPDQRSGDAVRAPDGPLGACSACHGSATNAAPPLSLAGTSSTSERAVGAHQQHLKSSAWHAPVQCNDCHLVPKTVTDPGHIDTALPAELTFSTLAQSDGAKPVWDGVKCSGVYCHGATLSAGTITAPTWAKVDGTQAACGTCHGLPPGGAHTTSTSCSTCHGAVVDANKKIIAPALHIDGKISASGGGHPTGWGAATVHGPAFLKDPSSCTSCHGTTLTGGSAKSCETCHPGWKTKCTFCHGGTSNQTGAPPVAVGGATATTVPGVGRHTSHVTASATHAAYGCAVCHKNPTDALSPGHIDPSPGEVVFSGLGAGTTYSFSSYTCSTIKCHGGKSALWVGSLTGGCAACHGDGTTGSLGGEHTQHISEGLGCSTCHSCVVNSSKQITDPTKHVNGGVDVCGTGVNYSNGSCTPACHGTETW